MERYIYLDNASTTKTADEVINEMIPYLSSKYGNPSSIYEFAVMNKKALSEARTSLSKLINCDSNSIYFTGSGSEADNWAIKGTAELLKGKGKHIITTKLEHHAVLNTCKYLEKKGYDITYIESGEDGIVSVESIKKAIRTDTILISVMTANNEIGTLQPIEQIGQLAKENKVIFHTDAVQALGHIKLDVEKMNIDLLSGSGHKLYGPKGIGMLFIRDTLKLPSFIHGGGQERGKRAGTENVPAIAGFGKAAELALVHMKEYEAYERELSQYLIKRITREIPYTRLNGDRQRRLSNNTNFSFQFVEGETLLIMLDMKKIYCSTGSACNAQSSSPSHVLMSIGLPEELVRGSLRLTISHETTKSDIDEAVDAIKEIVARLRGMNPFYLDLMKNF